MHVGARPPARTPGKNPRAARFENRPLAAPAGTNCRRNGRGRKNRARPWRAIRPWASRNSRRAEFRVSSPERLLYRFAQRDSDVFDGVVLVDIEIAARDEIEIEAAVPRDLLEHVIEEANARIDARLAAAVEIQLQPDIRFPWFCDAGVLFS